MVRENSLGQPLANANWLEIHHRAKLPERLSFANKLASINPKSIVDLGCASGLWLELLDKIMPSECEFIGVDSDSESLNIALNRSKSWKRKISFIQLDLEKDTHLIPPSDLTLAFNIFPYIHDLDKFVKILSSRTPRGTLAIRQYDGASIRFGPMETLKRQQIEADLRTCVENSQKFHHYDLDRTFSVLHKSSYEKCDYGFELFARISPFSDDFIPYYKETLEWTCQNISSVSANFLRKWIAEDLDMVQKYFYEVDLVALLS